jgi:ribosomal protein S18 acetylase RimI-like enzyme
VLAEWHADPEVWPFVLRVEGEPVAYGEIWADGGDAELARLLVAPEARSRGVGRRLAGLLAAEAKRRGFRDAWLRVVPTNGAALAAYRAAGFTRATPAEEAEFNAGQPREYAWLRL